MQVSEIMNLIDDFIHANSSIITTNVVRRQRIIAIDPFKIDSKYKELVESFENDPMNTYTLLNNALRSFIKSMNITDEYEAFSITFIPRTTVSIHELKKHINKYVAIKGLVTRQTAPSLLARNIHYICAQCGFDFNVSYQFFSSVGSERCPNCKSRNLSIDVEGSQFDQIVKYQITESGLDVSAQSVDVIVKSPLPFNVIKPGDKAIIGGIPMVDVIDIKGLARKGVMNVKPHLIAVYVNVENKSETIEETPLPPGNLREMAVASFAPHIIGKEYLPVKLSLLAAMVSSDPLELPNTLIQGDDIYQRGRIHVLMIGDPGVGKSELLRFANVVFPRSVYASGKGASGVGLTASVTKDSDGQWALAAGVMVLADQGLAIIDEFDKMDRDDRSAMHDAMEQGKIHIAKANIVADLNARATVIAAGNPVFGRWLANRSLQENIDIPPALLSRFDLVWVLVDSPNPDKDKSKVVSFNVTPPMDIKQLRSYIMKARSFKPVLRRELIESVASQWVDMRTTAFAKGGMLTLRSLYSILRIAVALAKLDFSQEVTSDHVNSAMDMFKRSAKQLGMIDDAAIDEMQLVGLPSNVREKALAMFDVLHTLQESSDDYRNNGVPRAVWVAEVTNQVPTIKQDEAYNLISRMEKIGLIYQPHLTRYKTVGDTAF